MLEEEEETRREGKRRNATDPPKTWREKFRSNCTWLEEIRREERKREKIVNNKIEKAKEKV